MTSLLVIIVLVLLAIALWQLTKIFDLTQMGQTAQNKQIATFADNRVQGYLLFGFAAFLYIFMIYGLIVWGPLVLDNPASEHGKDVDLLMNITWILIFIVQFITQLLLHYFAFKYRGTKDTKALYFADNNKLEFIWSVIPAVVLAGLILYGLYAWTNIMFVDEKEEDVIVIELYAKQFGWEARYAGEDNVLGKANVRYIAGINTLGVDMADPNAQDDKMATELHIPKGKKVLFKMRSQDVLHSAYMPHFRAQMNCVPGMVTQFAFTPTYTTEEYRAIPKIVEKVANINKLRAKQSIELTAQGKVALDPYEFNFLLLCNKICGASHYNMQMKVVVDTPEDFKAWLAEKPTMSQQMKEAEAAEQTITPTIQADSTQVEAPIVVMAN
ncbi:cytochrome c oxidase subunit II [Flavobacterium sp.]|uniref:cytochrome c oxidase subunit II n=1 Tax=Flavobacterium sp. TaxID=239 RepID=UPI0026109E75|nr:cytochrome c oxidase subunit II [Flavobacterium sp.]MDD3003356.1 cytochrome c oxidase subunit II [Flavobacterium sp.]